MINRVDNNSSYNQYTKVNTHKNDIPEGQFTLDYDNSGVIYEKEQDKDDANSSVPKGVELDLSVGNGNKTATTAKENIAIVYIRKAIEVAKEKFSAFLNYIWPSETDTQVQSDEQVNSAVEAVSETASVKAETEEQPTIDDILKSGDISELERYLSENGEKTLAKNSGLLTFYDKSGKIVNVDSSDSNRILHGDRNSWKL